MRKEAGWKVGRRLVEDLSLGLLVLHNQEELGVGNTSILVDVELGNALLSLGLLVPGEAAGDDGKHLVFRDEPALVRVELGELLPDLGLGLSAAMECVPQLGELGLVDTFVPILVRLQQQK